MSHCKTVYKKTTVRAAMMRRGRDGQARHSAWSETRQETDAVVVTQISDWEDWDSPTTQMGDLEAEASSDEAAVEAAAVAALPCSGAPVTGESFCQCPRQEELGLGFSAATDCLCGEEDQGFDWVWDEHCKSSGAFLSCDDRKVSFHSDYSCGTAAIRGTKELAEGQHFWEVKMTSPVYGTDMMVGIGTSEVNLEKFTHIFGSLLGHDEDSWGLSYTGLLQNKGDKVKFSSRFGQGSIIGMHLDTWHGTLTFYKNRHCIGVAATRLPNKKFYPMACSTAAKSSMKVIRARYTPTSLQYFCCARLRQMLPGVPDIRDVPDLPPGLGALLHSRLGWVFSLDPADSPEVFPEEPSLLSTSSSLESALSSPFPDAAAAAASYPCPCQTPPQGRPCTCLCPPTPPSSDYESCCSDPEDYQCKRCRWT